MSVKWYSRKWCVQTSSGVPYSYHWFKFKAEIKADHMNSLAKTFGFQIRYKVTKIG